MSRKPAAALSAGLVAVKGMAAPAPDMPTRAPPGGPNGAAIPEPASRTHHANPGGHSNPGHAEGEGGGMPLNFRVPAAFRRDFKVYAATHGLKLNELLRRCFEAYRSQTPGQTDNPGQTDK